MFTNIAPFVSGPNPRFFRTTSDTSNATTTLANVTGASWKVSANTNYAFLIFAICTSTVTTTGFKFAIDIPSGTITSSNIHFNNTTGSATGSGQRADAAAIGATVGVDATGSNVMVLIYGTMQIGATAGTAQLMHASETANSTTVVTGTTGIMFEEP